jgi:hypothetical protein
LPKKGRKTDEVRGEPKLPVELQGALHSLYGNYEKYYRLWEQNAEARARGITPPVFIVVCNNTNVSKLVFDYVAGWESRSAKGPSCRPDNYPFSATTMPTAEGCIVPTPSWWIASNSNLANR